MLIWWCLLDIVYLLAVNRYEAAWIDREIIATDLGYIAIAPWCRISHSEDYLVLTVPNCSIVPGLHTDHSGIGGDTVDGA